MLVLVAATMIAVAAVFLTWTFLSIRTNPRRKAVADWDFEAQRREHLRAGSSTYRWFEPLVEERAALLATKSDRAKSEQLALDLVVSQNPLPWLPDEYIAAAQVEAALIAVLCVGLGLVTSWYLTFFLTAAVVLLTYVPLAVKARTDAANNQRDEIRRRLPFAVDLMALMMQAGATFIHSLETTVREHRSHALGRELGLVLSEVSLGRTTAEAFGMLRTRLNDPDVSEFVSAVVRGEELGTPLSTILKTQADQMRLKRSQWAEKASAEAMVNITIPGMLSMLASLLLVVAFFVLPVFLGRF